jgi:hypothetical protein
VSRFSIPADARREDVPLDGEFALEAADQTCGLRRDGDELGDRFAMLRDDDALWAHPVEQGKTLGLELGGRNCFHEIDSTTGQKLCPQSILAQGTDWRFLNELKKELKG